MGPTFPITVARLEGGTPEQAMAGCTAIQQNTARPVAMAPGTLVRNRVAMANAASANDRRVRLSSAYCKARMTSGNRDSDVTRTKRQCHWLRRASAGPRARTESERAPPETPRRDWPPAAWLASRHARRMSSRKCGGPWQCRSLPRERDASTSRLQSEESRRARGIGPPADHGAARQPPHAYLASVSAFIRSALKVEGHQCRSMCSTTSSVPRSWLT